MESVSWATLTLSTFGISMELEIPEGKSKGKLNLRFSGRQPDLKLQPQFSVGVWPGSGISPQAAVHSQPWLLCPTKDGTVLGRLEPNILCRGWEMQNMLLEHSLLPRFGFSFFLFLFRGRLSIHGPHGLWHQTCCLSLPCVGIRGVCYYNTHPCFDSQTLFLQKCLGILMAVCEHA